MEKETKEQQEQQNILLILYAPYETGMEEYTLRARKYSNASEALWAFAEAPCHWSRLMGETEFKSKTEEQWIEQLIKEVSKQ